MSYRVGLRRIRINLFVAVLSVLILQSCHTKSTLQYSSEDVIEFPFTMVKDYPLVSAELDGRKGWFLFDTGARDSLKVNSDYYPLPKGSDTLFKSSTSNASGKKWTTRKVKIGAFSLAGIECKNSLVTGHSMEAMEQEWAKPFLGFIGWDLLRHHVMIIDGKRQMISLYTPESQSLNKVLKQLRNNKPADPIVFEYQKHLPMITVNLFGSGKAHQLVMSPDTGGSKYIFIEEKLKQDLIHNQILIPSINEKGDTIYSTLAKFGNNKKVFPMTNIKFQSFEQMKKSGVDEEGTIGFGFLKNYTTVWDFKNKTIEFFPTDKL